jgi:hypothetical protein
MIDPLPREELDLLLKRIEQLDVRRPALDHSAGMRVKSYDNRLAADPRGFLSQLFENLRVTDVNAVKSSYSYNRLSKRRQRVRMIVNLHPGGQS